MKIKNLIALLTLLTITQISFGQKVKIKKNIVTINKEVICKVEKDNVSQHAFYISNLENKQLLYFKLVDWGEYGYYETYKADDLDNILFETETGIGYRKWIIRKLFNAKVLTNSGLDKMKLNEFSKKIGKEFTRMRNRH